MATRISGEAGLSNLAQSTLIRDLRKKAGKREGVSDYIGLKRSSALSDVEDPGASLNNILDKISLTDSAERNLYRGPFNALDWDVTREFINDGIDRTFLRRLSGTSIAGGSLGSTVPTTPRIRIQDRVSFLNSFYGEGSFPGLHNGPDAQFYKGSEPQHIGYIRFTFSSSTGVATVSELKGVDGSTNLSEATILSGRTSVVLDLFEYEISGSDPISLNGLGLALRLDFPTTWVVDGILGLQSISDIVGAGTFGQLRFKITRPYSVINPPLWYSESPGDSSTSVPGSADDNDPVTTSKVLQSVNGEIVPRKQKGYWFSRAYVPTRWTSRERSLIGENSVTQDSNMRWQTPPYQLEGEIYNWGIRWDGYLRVLPGIYALELQTNVSVKIDMDIDGWTNVFDTDTAAREGEQLYISSSSFNTDSVDNKYKYFTGDDPNTDWVAYIPVTIRLFHGGPDKSEPELLVPSEPNLFIKTTTLSSDTNWYSDQFVVTLSGTDGNWTLTGPRISEVKAIRGDSDASVRYRLTAKGNDIFPDPVVIVLTTDGTSVFSSTTGLDAGTYTLSILTLRSSEFNNNLEAMWKGRIASPGPGQITYTDLTDTGYVPDMQRIPFDPRPQWWKVSEGYPFDRGDAPATDNTPLDGFIQNSFKPVLSSDAPGIGLYGDGAQPTVFTSIPNIILGEARYESSDPLGSNYVGLELTPNTLGEGGQLFLNALPVNNAVYSDQTLLGANDLGGSPNHLTVAGGKQTGRVIRLYLWTNTTQPSTDTYNKYYVISDLLSISGSDDPTVYGLPAFSSPDWLSPITITGIRLADDQTFTTNVKNFVAPLTITVEKVEIGGNNLLSFSVTLPSILDAGAEVSQFTTKYIEYYLESDVAFQYERVDTGESLSFSDVLKLTYDGSDNLIPTQSEVPRPPSDRVTPFGFDDPEFGSGVCYPPYGTVNTLLAGTAVDDTALYASPVGNYDVFWGDPTKSGLDGKVLEITEKLELSGDFAAIVALSSPVILTSNVYSHRLKIDIPIPPGSVPDDALEYIGNGEKVKDSYFAYVNLDS